MKENEQPGENKEQEGEKRRPRHERQINDLFKQEMFGGSEKPSPGKIGRRRFIFGSAATIFSAGMATDRFLLPYLWRRLNSEQETSSIPPEEKQAYDAFLNSILTPTGDLYPIHLGEIHVSGARLRYPHGPTSKDDQNILFQKGIEIVENPIIYQKFMYQDGDQENSTPDRQEWLVYFSEKAQSFVCVSPNNKGVTSMIDQPAASLPYVSCTTESYYSYMDSYTQKQTSRLEARLPNNSSLHIAYVVSSSEDSSR